MHSDMLTTEQSNYNAPVSYTHLNEKGVSIAVLTLDSEPTNQDTGKPVLATTMAIRLVLDRAATTAEAVELLQQYDMFATSGRDYHFYITDAAGDGRVIEYDCDDPARPMVVTQMCIRDRPVPNGNNAPAPGLIRTWIGPAAAAVVMMVVCGAASRVVFGFLY